TRTHRCLGEAHLALQKPDEAMREIEAGLQWLAGTIEVDEWRKAELLETKARAHFNQKDYAKALIDMAEAEELAKKVKNIPVRVRVRHLRGELFLTRDDLDKAQDEFKEAALLASKYGLDVAAARSLREIAKFAEKRASFSEAYWAANKAG